MDDLKERIWDYLYRAGEPQAITVIAEQMSLAPVEIEQALDDSWFDVKDGQVAIAYN